MPAPRPPAAASTGAAATATAAVVLTGGTGGRLGGADKAGLALGGRSFLSRALEAVAGLQVVVVGDPVEAVRTVRESPPGGGPAAGLLAGLDALGPDVASVVVLAVDMPLVTATTVARLRAAYEREGGDGALLVDADGRAQYLCGVYRVAALRAAAPPSGERHGLPVRRLLAPLALVELPAEGGEAHDVDEWPDLDGLDGLDG
ncbi:molybdenum cofactor guanylyltransferase [Nocardioides aurantiacus]|uniref:Molybdopterin-guanine dinucleotide biosynthesis protein A n=1 Tax=Nocardioides aurantiacus TaxID=86796 RepID=A0A3N2CNU9_9ACTN|nr:NTP transferase domain-containing protein [Nocardioides aurantiacus]ROR89191.1 molybdopterin-guanine dinucleotide biosynthesis protein A [Nocardioides aurantiacus]